MPTAYVSGVIEPFKEQLDVFINNASAAFQSIAQTGQRKWDVPYTHLGWDKNVLNYTGANSIASAFDRALLTSSYWNALSNGAKLSSDYGKVAECRCAKYQIDALGSMERAFRERSRSYVRAAYVTASRYQGHASQQGPIADLVQVVNRMIAQSSVDNIPEQRPRVNTRQKFSDIDSSSPASVGAFQ